jgi:hypothetical protein
MTSTDILTIEFPGEPKASVEGPSYLTWSAKTRIGSASQKETPQGAFATDLSKMFDALVHSWARHPATRGHIHDHKHALIPFADDVIDEHADPEDVAYLALRLGQEFYPEVFGEPESADPNAEEAPTELEPTPLPPPRRSPGTRSKTPA